MRNIKFIKAMRLSLLVAMLSLGFTTMSCTPEPCEDCYTYTYSDGSTEWMCVEYDCSDYNY